MTPKITFLSRLLLALAAILMTITLFVPLWRIYLNAPQYPEGLSLQIWPHKISGDVDIINGLNHYIGMKTLHTKDFIEFTLLPYIIGLFALVFVAAALAGKRKWLQVAFWALVLFGIIAMVDFWKWEYDYGHNLDPNAAIKVPGMAYQPPLIGFKQLLNFGAYSIPDTGGWLFISAGLLLLIAVLKESNLFKKFYHRKLTGCILLSAFLLNSCASKGPQAIKLNKDACEFCKMTISDARFMAEIITSKGRVYKFDDLHCLQHYTSALPEGNIAMQYVCDYTNPPQFIDAASAWYLEHPSLKSPMGGNIAAFATKEAADSQASKIGGQSKNWQNLKKGN